MQVVFIKILSTLQLGLGFSPSSLFPIRHVDRSIVFVAQLRVLITNVEFLFQAELRASVFDIEEGLPLALLCNCNDIRAKQLHFLILCSSLYLLLTSHLLESRGRCHFFIFRIFFEDEDLSNYQSFCFFLINLHVLELVPALSNDSKLQYYTSERENVQEH